MPVGYSTPGELINRALVTRMFASKRADLPARKKGGPQHYLRPSARYAG